jgi:two-component system KDP operon response regulator KdpE
LSQILVVEDDAAAREMLAAVLRAHGHEVRTATDGRSAIQALESFVANVIVLDLGLPVASGFEVLHELRSAPGTRQTPVIAVSGHDRGVQLARENPEFSAALLKPFDPEALVRAVARALQRPMPL